jgi:hypothetical protein
MAVAEEWAAIAHLLLPSRPSTVVWLVIAVVVDPIQRQAVGALSHIGEKPSKRRQRSQTVIPRPP